MCRPRQSVDCADRRRQVSPSMRSWLRMRIGWMRHGKRGPALQTVKWCLDGPMMPQGDRSMTMTTDRISQFEKMAREDPTNEMAHFSLGNSYLEAGRAAEAAKSFENCVA